MEHSYVQGSEGEGAGEHKHKHHPGPYSHDKRGTEAVVQEGHTMATAQLEAPMGRKGNPLSKGKLGTEGTSPRMAPLPDGGRA